MNGAVVTYYFQSVTLKDEIPVHNLQRGWKVIRLLIIILRKFPSSGELPPRFE
jgi:hypothetical protein